MVILIQITFASVVVFGIWLGIQCWYLGADYVIKGNFGKRLNPIQKWLNGLDNLLKM